MQPAPDADAVRAHGVGISARGGDIYRPLCIDREPADVVPDAECAPVQHPSFLSFDDDGTRPDCSRFRPEIKPEPFKTLRRQDELDVLASRGHGRVRAFPEPQPFPFGCRVERLADGGFPELEIDEDGNAAAEPRPAAEDEEHGGQQRGGKDPSESVPEFPGRDAGPYPFFVQSSFHRHFRICLPVDQALKCVAPPRRGDSDVGNSIRFRRAL